MRWMVIVSSVSSQWGESEWERGQASEVADDRDDEVGARRTEIVNLKEASS